MAGPTRSLTGKVLAKVRWCAVSASISSQIQGVLAAVPFVVVLESAIPSSAPGAAPRVFLVMVTKAALHCSSPRAVVHLMCQLCVPLAVPRAWLHELLCGLALQLDR